jgi:flagellin
MSVINTNVSATLTSNALAKNDRAMSQSMERLSTGQRINSASDDAAGLAIASKMTSQIRGLDQAVRNGNDAISMLQTADGALIEVSNMLQRMRELSVQSASGTNTSTDRSALQIEFSALAAQIEDIGTDTTWNGQELLGATPIAASFQVGANASQTISHTFAQIKSSTVETATIANSGSTSATATFAATTYALGDSINFSVDGVTFSAKVTTLDSSANKIEGIKLDGASAEITTSNVAIATSSNGATINLKIAADNVLTFTSTANVAITAAASTRGAIAGPQSISIATQAGSANAIKTLDYALEQLNSSRATVGATVNRIEYAVDNLANVSQNAAASRSRVQDANYATESTELARTQIIQQAGTAMLAQANQQSQSVLALLK